ncbi:hypothetical protein [Roseobacter weihaiensis]|uniref:hypothetical protein n=1 Tax=Roseobacter weihaiensis TaxID=2763262 RepID=UPI001D0B8204|nr:hypothetical protein [Roseobacter sp. H9]
MTPDDHRLLRYLELKLDYAVSPIPTLAAVTPPPVTGLTTAACDFSTILSNIAPVPSAWHLCSSVGKALEKIFYGYL